MSYKLLGHLVYYPFERSVSIQQRNSIDRTPSFRITNRKATSSFLILLFPAPLVTTFALAV